MIKKINSVVALLLMISMTTHIYTVVSAFITGHYNVSLGRVCAYFTEWLCISHIGLVVLMLIFFHPHGRDNLSYKKRNLTTWLQRISGVLVLIFIEPHIVSAKYLLFNRQWEPARAALSIAALAIFFAVIFIHISVSFSKMLITFGLISTDAAEKRTNIIAMIACVVAYIFILLTMFNYFF